MRSPTRRFCQVESPAVSSVLCQTLSAAGRHCLLEDIVANVVTIALVLKTIAQIAAKGVKLSLAYGCGGQTSRRRLVWV